MQPRPTIIGVDDDPTARTFIHEALSALAVNVFVTANCREFDKMAASLAANLYLIDLELPDGDGFGLASRLRRRHAAPVIFLTVHADAPNRLRALELGAVEYLSKPIGPREFLLRIHNVLVSLGFQEGLAGRQPTEAAPRAPTGTTRCFGALTFDLMRRCLIAEDGEPCRLTASEFEVLDLLTGEAQRVMSRQDIAQRLGPQSAAKHNGRIVDVLVWRLRKKLEQLAPGRRFIATVPSRGYVFCEPVLER